MCGIAGVLLPATATRSVDRLSLPREAAGRMVTNMRHRGPDASGLDVLGDEAGGPVVALGHARLAIIDLSPAGRQPMVSTDAAACVTFNGEIYNFQSVRATLGEHGWRSQSDTEVLLRAYTTWGRGCLEHLRGMFAFALWDADRRELFLARDRLGIKPLYYATTQDGAFVFASEVRALLASGLVPPRLDRAAVGQYLAYQTVPAPRTLIEGVRALPPGCWLTVDAEGRVRQERYWDLLDAAQEPHDPPTPTDSRRHLADLLREAVAQHLVSDVPVGAFLSGGIDSTAVVGLMREAGITPRTFSVIFRERRYDESPHARTVAERFQADHTEILLHEPDLLDQVPEALDAMDQPTGDGVNTYVVSRAVRAAGITVALSGLGGDELFAGYPSFARLSRSAALFNAWGRVPRGLRGLAAHGVRTLGGASVTANKAAAMLASDGRLAQLYPLTREVLSPAQRQALLTPEWAEMDADQVDPYVSLLDEAFGRYPEIGPLTAISYAEARTYMHDLLLRDTDQMSMAHSLEVRVPLLDHVVVEYLMRLPDAHKQPAGLPKRLLVESLPGLLPDSIVRRPKQGFTLPFDVWMRGPLQAYCTHKVNGLGGRGIVRPETLNGMWQAFLAGQPQVSWSRVWVLVAFETWLERNGF